jgi:hypothetical protein
MRYKNTIYAVAASAVVAGLITIGFVNLGDATPDSTKKQVEQLTEVNHIVADTDTLAKSVLGMAEADAVQKIEAAGKLYRVVAREGKHIPQDGSWSGRRINLVVTEGSVKSAYTG